MSKLVYSTVVGHISGVTGVRPTTHVTPEAMTYSDGMNDG